jgi:hypothetical protein
MSARRPTAVTRFRRVVGATLFVAASATALAAAGPDALAPFRAVAGAAASEVEVAFVIDFGGSTHPSVGCVKVPATDSGYQALAAFTAQEGEQAPTYNTSGLLCSIDDIPSSGCGRVVSGGYIYWSYWDATSGKWKYADTGAFATVSNGDVQGWRFQDPGKANPTDPPPTTSPNFASICSSTTTPTTTTTTITATTPTTTQTTPTTTPPATTPSTTSVVAPSHGTTSSKAGPGNSSGSGSTSPPASRAGKGGSPSAGGPGAPNRSTRTTDPPTKGPGPASGPGPSTRTRSAGSPAPSTITDSSGASQAQSLRASAAVDRTGGGDSAVPLVVGSLLIVALMMVAVVRWRRRPGSP